MAEFPALPLFTDAYLGDTTHLTTIEHGAYLLLLITMWRAKGQKLPDNDAMLARYTRTTKGQWARLRPVIEAFFRVRDGFWTQGRLTDEHEAVRQKSKRQSDKARARWLINKETPQAVAEPQLSRDDASLTLTHTQKDSKESYSPDFERFWNQYPAERRKEKPKAKDEWDKAKRKADPGEIISGLMAYCLTRECREGYAPYPAKWLKNERWNEDHAADQSRKPTASTKFTQLTDAIDGMFD